MSLHIIRAEALFWEHGTFPDGCRRDTHVEEGARHQEARPPSG
jgi:hypothetical protein